jgi:dihydrofolate reductase
MMDILSGVTPLIVDVRQTRSSPVGPLFDWYGSGDVEVRWPGNEMVSRTPPASATYLREVIESAGALVMGRRLFEYTDGWHGRHPLGVPVFVVTHRAPKEWRHDSSLTTFVTDGLESAVARAKDTAGDKAVGVAGPNIAQQCLAAGFLDAIHVELVPVLLDTGIRFFDDRSSARVMLENPTVIEGDRVTHLRYEVRRRTSEQTI